MARSGESMSPRLRKKEVREIQEVYLQVEGEISKRCDEFLSLWNSGDEESIFEELIFCLLTPQSKAKACWAAVERLRDEDLLFRGGKKQISKRLTGVRFHNNKAGYIVEARRTFLKDGRPALRQVISEFESGEDAREWLVKNVKGLGFKEASHFLRNIGFCGDIAILDRHILKNLVLLGVIDEVPGSLTRNRYMEIEGRMKVASGEIGILPSHLDLVLWYKEAGEVFK